MFSSEMNCVEEDKSSCSLHEAMAEDLAERFKALLGREEMYKCSDYLSEVSAESGGGSTVTNQECRVTMAAWCYQMVDFCNFSHDTAALALTFLDRFLTTTQGKPLLRDRRLFQLACMCSLELAVKLHESTKLDVNLLSELSKGCYSADEIIDMEMKMLFALGWLLSPPTPATFLDMFIQLLSPIVNQTLPNTLSKLARIQMESASKDYYFSTAKASDVALASLLNAIDEIDLHCLPLNVRKAFLQDITSIAGVDYTNRSIQHLKSKLNKYLIANLPQLTSLNIKIRESRSTVGIYCTATTATPTSPTSIHKWT